MPKRTQNLLCYFGGFLLLLYVGFHVNYYIHTGSWTANQRWYKKGMTALREGKWEEGIKCFDKALAIDSENIAALHNKGVALNQLEKYEKAIKCFDKALAIDKGSKATWLAKGIVLYQLGKYKKSLECIDLALKFDPHYKKAKIARESVLEKLNVVTTQTTVPQSTPTSTPTTVPTQTFETDLTDGAIESAAATYDESEEKLSVTIRFSPVPSPSLQSLEGWDPENTYLERIEIVMADNPDWNFSNVTSGHGTMTTSEEQLFYNEWCSNFTFDVTHSLSVAQCLIYTVELVGVEKAEGHTGSSYDVSINFFMGTRTKKVGPLTIIMTLNTD